MASVGVKVYLEGAAEYRQKMSEMTSQTKLYQAQMKNLQSQLGKSTFSKSIQESKLLAQELKTLRDKSAVLEQRIKEATAAYGADSKEVRNLTTQYERLQAQINKVDAELKEHGGVLGAVGSQMQEVGQKMQAVGDKIAGVGDKLTRTVTMPIVGVGVAAVKAASDWESAFTGVMKTVDETATTSYEAIAEGIKKMATETASSKEEIAGVAEVAGQLGVSADDILSFTKTMVMLGDTTNLSADEAASALAKFMNITGESQRDVSKIGSAIVDLGNNFATTEADIVEMSTRLAATGTIAGLSSTDILALATAMSSVGINAEAGGTAMAQTLKQIQTETAHWAAGEDNVLTTIASVADMTAEEFYKAWKEKPVMAIQAFTKGLGSLDEDEKSAIELLEEMGMSGVRQSNMLQALGLASDVLSDAVSTSSRAYAENNALTDEAAKRYETFEAKISQVKESIGNVAIEIGERLMPYVERGLEVVEKLVAKWDELSPEMQDTIIKAAAIAAAIGPILAVGGRLISGIGFITNGIGGLFRNLPTLAAAIGGISLPVVAVVAAIAALVAGFVALYNTNDEFRAKVNETWAEIQVLIGNVCASIGELVGALMARLQEFWEAHGDQITSFLSALFDVLSVVVKTFLTLTADLIDFWTAVINGDWEGAWDAIKNIFTHTWEAMQAFFLAIIPAIKSYFELWLTTTVDFLRAKFELIYTIVSNIGKKIKEFTRAILNAIWQIWLNIWTSIVNTVSQKINDAYNKISSGLNNARQIVSSVISGIYSFIAQMLSSIISSVSSTINSAISTVSSGANAIYSAVTGMINNITGAISGLLSSAWSWGSDFINGFKDGIMSGVNAVLDQVRSMAQGVKNLIHFTHPDEGPLKDFDKWPRHMMQQYAAGIEAGRYLVQHAVSDVTADVAMMQGGTLSPDEIYNAINAGASSAHPTIVIGDRELGRVLRDMGVVMA